MRFEIDDPPNQPPHWWKNFRKAMYHSVKQQGVQSRGSDTTFGKYMSKSEVELLKYSGTHKFDSTGRRYIEFEDPRKAMIFILKWS